MVWEYALVSLVHGIAIGAIAMCLVNCKRNQKEAMRNELYKRRSKLEKYNQKLIDLFYMQRRASK